MRPQVIIAFFLAFFLIATSLVSYSQKQYFSLKITIQNCDSTGIAWRSYNFDNKRITIYEKPFKNTNYKEHLYTVRKYNSTDLFKKVIELRLDSVKSNYQNKCITKGAGREYIIEYKTENVFANIKVFEYYEALIDELINLINAELPKSLKVDYFSINTKQDCI